MGKRRHHSKFMGEAANLDVGVYELSSLREGLAGDCADFSDEDLMKFICARKGDVERTIKLVDAHVAWKKEKFGMAATAKPAAAAVAAVAASGFMCIPGLRDKEGHLVALVQPAKLDMSRFTAADVVAFVWFAIDKAMDDPFSRQRGIVIVEDMGDVTMGFVASAFPSLPRELLKGLTGAIPARVRHAYVQYQPWHLGTAISGIKGTLMPAKLASKMHLCYDKLEKLHDCVSPDQLPDRFGGVHNWDQLRAEYLTTHDLI